MWESDRENPAIAAIESRTRAALRDTLLLKLISGEIRVGQAEAPLETAS